jgi:protein-disulfide isomerase
MGAILAVPNTSRTFYFSRDRPIDGQIAREFAPGEKRKISTTPTIFIYALGQEHRVSGVLPYPAFKSFFESILK